MKRWLLPALLVAILIGAWQVAASTGAIASALHLEDFLVPSPAEIASSLWENRSLIAENAYLRAERRGFAPGHETEDWLEAEAEVDALLKAEQSPRQ